MTSKACCQKRKKSKALPVTYITHKDIDKGKWDAVIRSADNGLIYGYSYFLDKMSPGWDALILGAYETVMPLTWNRKFGIRYLYQPAFTQQLGIFGKDSNDPKTVSLFLQEAAHHFRFAEICLNYRNHTSQSEYQRCNLILPLDRTFEKIEESFRKDLLQNVRKAKSLELQYEAGADFKKVISLYQQSYGSRMALPKDSFENFNSLCQVLLVKDQLLLRHVTSKDGRMLAAGLFLKDENRIYKTMTVTLAEGRTAEANHLLLYELIKEHAGTHTTFDMSGSDVPSIKSFLIKFGAVVQPYPFVRINRLPFPLNQIKKISGKSRRH